MGIIGNKLSESDYEKVQNFLSKIRPLLATNDATIEVRDKNQAFDKLYNLRHSEKIEILKSLSADDCINVSPNNNPRFPNAEVYTFLKDVTITVYGEDESITLYLKMYIAEHPSYDIVVVISFHPSDDYD